MVTYGERMLAGGFLIFLGILIITLAIIGFQTAEGDAEPRFTDIALIPALVFGILLLTLGLSYFIEGLIKKSF